MMSQKRAGEWDSRARMDADVAVVVDVRRS